MNPIDELHTAATKLRETASKATPGPWTDRSTDDTGAWPIMIVGGDDSPGDGRGEPVLIVHESVTEEIVGREDAAWIALAGPQIAEPLAEQLEETASWWDQFSLTPEPTNPALVLARAINGGAR